MIPYIALISTYVVFGGLGYFVSRRFKKRVTVNTWIVLAVATVFSQWVMPNAWVIGAWEFHMTVNYSLQGFFGGMLAGLSLRAIRAA